MEIKIKISDIFPSINELSKDNDLIIHINENEYLLKDIINKEFSLMPCSIINVLIKKKYQNQILGEGKIELNKMLLINSSKNIITWLKLLKEKKIKKSNNIKNDILNNILDFLKIKIHLTILNKEKHKTNFIPIDNFNKIQNNKEILKSKSPVLNKFIPIYSNNTLLKNYNGKINSKNLTRNEINNIKSISFLNKTHKKKNRPNSIIYKKEKMALSTTNIFGQINYTSNSFINDNDEDLKKKERTHSKQNLSKTSKLSKNNKSKKKFLTEEKKINKFDINNSYDVNNLKKNLNNINLFQEDNFLNESNNNFYNEIKSNSKEHFENKKIEPFGSIEIMDIINQNNDINLKDINEDELNKSINDLIIKQEEHLSDIPDDNITKKPEENLSIKQYNNLLINHSINSDNDEINENIEDNPIDAEFLGLKNDFEIFYTKDYLENINHEFFKLEIELCFEKILELILTYHYTLKVYELKNNFRQRRINQYISEIKILNKQLSKIKILNKRYNNNKDYIDICKLIKQNKINLLKKNCQNELDLFKFFLLETNNNKYVKLKNIFSKIYLNHHHKINDSETKTTIKTIFPDLSITHKKFLSLDISNQNKQKYSYSNINTFSSFKRNKNKINKSVNINNNINLTDSKKSKISIYSGNTTVTNDFKFS